MIKVTPGIYFILQLKVNKLNKLKITILNPILSMRYWFFCNH